MGDDIIQPLVSVVLGTYNRRIFLNLTIESIRKELHDFPHEIIVVDGGSSDGTLNWLARQKDIITIVQHNRGEWMGKTLERRSWGYFMNLGFKCAQGKYVCMLSDDCLVVPGAIRNGYEFFETELAKNERLGAVPFYFTLNYPITVDYVVIRVGEYIYVNHGLYLKKALAEVDYIDEETYQFYAADVDLCLKIMSSGYAIKACEYSKIIHFSHINEKVRSTNATILRDSSLLKEKWNHLFENSNRDTTAEIIKLDDSFVFSDFYRISLRLIMVISGVKFVTKLREIRSKMFAWRGFWKP